MLSSPTSGPELPGSIALTRDLRGTVLRLDGEIDTAVVQAFDRHQDGAPLVPVDVIDAAAVSFIDSVGLALLVRCMRQSTGAGRRPLLEQSAPVRMVLRLAGLAPVFEGRPAAPAAA